MKTASHMAFFTTVLVYSTAIPDLMGILPFYFIFHFWLDKWQILNFCKVPPRYSLELSTRANNLMIFAIFVHLMAAMWTLSTPEIFPSRILVYEASTRVTYYFMEQLSMLERFYNPKVVYHLLLTGASLAIFFLLEPFVREILKLCFLKCTKAGKKSRISTI